MRCAFCHGDLGTDAGRCDGCGTRLHLDCARILGTCPTLGCGRTWAAAERAWAAPPAPGRRRRVATLAAAFAGTSASLLLYASQTPFDGGRGLDARARHLHATAPLGVDETRRRDAHLSDRTAPAPSPPPPSLPGDAPPADVLTACRSLLDRPELRRARLGPEQVATLAPALGRLRPTRVVVERAAVVVDLGRGKGLVALPAGGRWEDVEAFASTRSYTLEKVIDDLWRYTRW